VPCSVKFSEERCEAMAERAANDLDVPFDIVEALTILPDPEPDAMRLGGPPVYLRVQLADGTARETVIHCPGISAAFDPSCMDDPKLRPASATISGYRDVPCADDEGQYCATPHPAIDPDAADAADPIMIDRIDVPIDHEGDYDVHLAQGSLPNGILTEASFAFVVGWPDDVTLPDGRVLLDVRSLEPDGRPFDNYYLHGWREGVERVEAVLVFTVARFEPGAVLSIADVVVR
jgi:hypothetical protein